MDEALRILEDRPLTSDEQTLVRWLLEHGWAGAAAFLPQVDKLRVVSRCGCGCASIDFALSEPMPGPSLTILADYEWQEANGALNGAFVFARAGYLAGLEVWSIDGRSAPQLPTPDQLRRIAH